MHRNALNKQIADKRKVSAARHSPRSSHMHVVMLDITLNDSNAACLLATFVLLLDMHVSCTMYLQLAPVFVGEAACNRQHVTGSM